MCHCVQVASTTEPVRRPATSKRVGPAGQVLDLQRVGQAIPHQSQLRLTAVDETIAREEALAQGTDCKDCDGVLQHHAFVDTEALASFRGMKNHDHSGPLEEDL